MTRTPITPFSLAYNLVTLDVERYGGTDVVVPADLYDELTRNYPDDRRLVLKAGSYHFEPRREWSVPCGTLAATDALLDATTLREQRSNNLLAVTGDAVQRYESLYGTSRDIDRR